MIPQLLLPLGFSVTLAFMAVWFHAKWILLGVLAGTAYIALTIIAGFILSRKIIK